MMVQLPPNPQPPHTAIDVKRINSQIIPDRIYYVYIKYDAYPDRMFHKIFESKEEAFKYVERYRNLIAGELIFKEYFSLSSLTKSTNQLKPYKKKKKDQAVSKTRSRPIKSGKPHRGVRK